MNKTNTVFTIVIIISIVGSIIGYNDNGLLGLIFGLFSSIAVFTIFSAFYSILKILFNEN